MKRTLIHITYITIKNSTPYFGTSDEAFNKFKELLEYDHTKEYVVVQDMESGDWDIYQLE